ncbi:MAG: zinc-ribbon domain-containing protein [Verrucomicrobia bacterium]|nr:zinc-ribbon domain-containing protein [Verrucomicrobiota bacterium]
MALVKCPECGRDISSNAESCPNCGNPMAGKGAHQRTGTFCPRCRTRVTPVVTSVGGGSCSFGKRETWKCPQCTRVLHRSGCLVATVTYGDEDMIEVRFLRAFRDEVLCKSMGGRLLAWTYYHVGSHVAHLVELVPPLRALCRRILDRIIETIEATTDLKRSAFREPRP